MICPLFINHHSFLNPNGSPNGREAYPDVWLHTAQETFYYSPPFLIPNQRLHIEYIIYVWLQIFPLHVHSTLCLCVQLRVYVCVCAKKPRRSPPPLSAGARVSPPLQTAQLRRGVPSCRRRPMAPKEPERPRAPRRCRRPRQSRYQLNLGGVSGIESLEFQAKKSQIKPPSYLSVRRLRSRQVTLPSRTAANPQL